jgi:hypothetical protein
MKLGKDFVSLYYIYIYLFIPLYRLKINQNILSYPIKNQIRNKLDSFQKDLYINKTKQLTQMIDIGIEKAKQVCILGNNDYNNLFLNLIFIIRK